MRISTSQMQMTAVNSILQRQSELSHTQLQVATGKRVVKPSDDPVASASILNLEQSKAQTERYQLNADAARARLSIEEGALTGVTEQLHRVRELAVYANNTHITNNDRASMAEELHQILDEVMGLANTTDNNNQYLFSGNQGLTKPFSETSSGFEYNGDGGQRFLQVGPSRRVADGDPGNDVFMNIKNGNGIFRTDVARDVNGDENNSGSGVISAGSVVNHNDITGHDYTITFDDYSGDGVLEYQINDQTDTSVNPIVTANYEEGAAITIPGHGIQVTVKGQPDIGDSFTIEPSVEQNLFATINNLIQAVETPVVDENSQANLNNAINRTLVDIDQSLETVLNVRADVGARLNTIDSQVNNNENFMLQVDESISVLNDLDYAEAVSRMNLQLTGLEASQKAFTRVQGLSLFNYI